MTTVATIVPSPLLRKNPLGLAKATSLYHIRRNRECFGKPLDRIQILRLFLQCFRAICAAGKIQIPAILRQDRPNSCPRYSTDGIELWASRYLIRQCRTRLVRSGLRWTIIPATSEANG